MYVCNNAHKNTISQEQHMYVVRSINGHYIHATPNADYAQLVSGDVPGSCVWLELDA